MKDKNELVYWYIDHVIFRTILLFLLFKCAVIISRYWYD